MSSAYEIYRASAVQWQFQWKKLSDKLKDINGTTFFFINFGAYIDAPMSKSLAFTAVGCLFESMNYEWYLQKRTNYAGDFQELYSLHLLYILLLSVSFLPLIIVQDP